MVSSASVPSWLDPQRPVPDIRTELPGPLAREVYKRDQAITSPTRTNVNDFRAILLVRG